MKWERLTLREVADVESGFGFPREYQGEKDGQFPFFKVSDMNLPGNEVEMSVASNTVSARILDQLRAKVFPAGAVIFPKIGAAIATNKKRVLSRPATIDNNVMALIPRAGTHPKFLYYWALTFDLRTVSNIGPVPSIRKTEIETTPFTRPPVPEQRRIVEILDQADSLRKKRAEADAKAARIIPALFVKMFGDPVTNSRQWQVRKLGEVIADTRNGLYKPSEFYGRGIGILKMFNIKNGEIDLSRVDMIDVSANEYEAYRLLPGDILINRVNTPELVGKCAVINEEVGKAVFESKNIRVRVKTDIVTPEYIASYLNSPFGHGVLRLGVKHAIGMATINGSDLSNTPVPLPHWELQENWTSLVQTLRGLVANTRNSRNKLDRLFKNLLQRAFTGDLTAKWRESHMKELLTDMEQEARTQVAGP